MLLGGLSDNTQRHSLGVECLGGEFESFSTGTRRSSAEGAATRDSVGKAIRRPIQRRSSVTDGLVQRSACSREV